MKVLIPCQMVFEWCLDVVLCCWLGDGVQGFQAAGVGPDYQVGGGVQGYYWWFCEVLDYLKEVYEGLDY